jgi:adenylate kinase family enzyme
MHDTSNTVKPLVESRHPNDGRLDGSRPRPRRVAVIGRAGAGKTTVALRLGEELGLPVIHLDRLAWDPGWQAVAEATFESRQAAAVAGDAWVIDGGYLSSPGWPERMRRADLVVLVEAPLVVCLARIIRRSLARTGTRRPDLPDGCDEAFSLFFLRWTLGWSCRNEELLTRIERARPVVRIAHRSNTGHRIRVPHWSVRRPRRRPDVNRASARQARPAIVGVPAHHAPLSGRRP